MKSKIEFINGVCMFVMEPEDDWEKYLLGAVAKGGQSLSAMVEYKPDGHFSYYKAAVVKVMLEAAKGD